MKFPFDIFTPGVAELEPSDELARRAEVDALSIVDSYHSPEDDTVFAMDSLRELQAEMELPKKHSLHDHFRDIQHEIFKKDFNSNTTNEIYNENIIHNKIKQNYNSYNTPIVLPPLDSFDYMPTPRALSPDQESKLADDLSDLAGL